MRRMSVTFTVRTAGLVFDWIYQTKNSLALGSRKDANPVRTIQACKRFSLSMTGGTGFSFFVYKGFYLMAGSGETDFSLLVKNANLADASQAQRQWW